MLVEEREGVQVGRAPGPRLDKRCVGHGQGQASLLGRVKADLPTLHLPTSHPPPTSPPARNASESVAVGTHNLLGGVEAAVGRWRKRGGVGGLASS